MSNIHLTMAHIQEYELKKHKYKENNYKFSHENNMAALKS